MTLMNKRSNWIAHSQRVILFAHYHNRSSHFLASEEVILFYLPPDLLFQLHKLRPTNEQTRKQTKPQYRTLNTDDLPWTLLGPHWVLSRDASSMHPWLPLFLWLGQHLTDWWHWILGGKVRVCPHLHWRMINDKYTYVRFWLLSQAAV